MRQFRFNTTHWSETMTQTAQSDRNEAQFNSLSSLLRHALDDDMLSSDAETLLDMMSDDIVFEFPFPIPNGTRRIEGKTALENYLPLVGKALSIEVLTLKRSMIAEDRAGAVLEFSCQGTSKTSGTRYDQDYVSVIDLCGGRISRYRDYWNPLIVQTALGDSELMMAPRVIRS